MQQKFHIEINENWKSMLIIKSTLLYIHLRFIINSCFLHHIRLYAKLSKKKTKTTIENCTCHIHQVCFHKIVVDTHAQNRPCRQSHIMSIVESWRIYSRKKEVISTCSIIGVSELNWWKEYKNKNCTKQIIFIVHSVLVGTQGDQPHYIWSLWIAASSEM